MNPIGTPGPNPADAHLAAETVADHLEGLLSAAESARVDRHLAGCGTCTELAEALGSVRALLGSAAPQPMPGEVADRMDAVLAGLTLPDAAPLVESAGSPVTDLAEARRRRRRYQLLSAAAAVAVVAVGAGTYSRIVASQESASTATAPVPVPHSKQGDLGINGLPESGGVPTPQTPARRATEPVVPLRSGLNYTAAEFEQRVRDLVELDAKQPGLGDTRTEGESARAEAARVTGCAVAAAETVRGRPDQPYLADLASYEGRQAVVLLYRGSDGSNRTEAYALPARCPAGPPLHHRALRTG